LKEKRQAVISHAVTKGLNPDVKMKDSGIEWLGEVPEGWEVLALKHLTSLRSGDGITGDSIEESGDYPVFGGNGLRGFTDAFTHDGHYVIIGRQGALCGNVNYGQGKFWASEHAVVATPLRAVDTVWLGEMIRSMNLNQYSETAAQPGLSMVAVGNLRTVLPPIKEQKEIAKFVTNMITEFDSLGAQAERSIELLQERRTALISAAVTGKIDVRQFATEVVA
jgi:type I restriction enzyme S subunit